MINKALHANISPSASASIGDQVSDSEEIGIQVSEDIIVCSTSSQPWPYTIKVSLGLIGLLMLVAILKSRSWKYWWWMLGISFLPVGVVAIERASALARARREIGVSPPSSVTDIWPEAEAEVNSATAWGLMIAVIPLVLTALVIACKFGLRRLRRGAGVDLRS